MKTKQIMVGLAIFTLILWGCAKPSLPEVKSAVKTEPAEETKSAETVKAEPAAPVVRTPKQVNELLGEDVISLTTFPEEVKKTFESGVRYKVEFQADAPIQVVVYNEQRYNEWKNTGKHTISKATTNAGNQCCQESGEFTFDVNNGEGGNYYIVFDDSLLPIGSSKPTQTTIRVVKLAII